MFLRTAGCLLSSWWHHKVSTPPIYEVQGKSTYQPMNSRKPKLPKTFIHQFTIPTTHNLSTFSLSRTNNVELAQALSWRENALFGEREKNVFVKPNERCRACSSIVMARKRTFRGMREEFKNSSAHQLINSKT